MTDLATKDSQDWFTDSSDLDRPGQGIVVHQPARSKAAEAKKKVEAFRKRSPASRWANLDLAGVADSLVERLDDPNGMAQGQSSLCGVFAFARVWCSESPIEFAELAMDLFEKGEGVLRGHNRVGGKVIRPSDATRRSPRAALYEHGKELVSQVDWLVCASIRDSFNIFLDYKTGFMEEQRGGSMASVVAGELRAVGYAKVENRATIMPAGWDNFIDATLRYERGWRVMLFVHSNIFDYDKIGTTMGGGRHWIGLEGKVKIGMFGPRRMVEPFTVWTWGGRTTIPSPRAGRGATKTTPAVLAAPARAVPFEVFAENYYGFVAGLL
jgi:hypothetical protein